MSTLKDSLPTGVRLRAFAHAGLSAAAVLIGGLPLMAQDALPVQESVFTAAVTTESGGDAWAYVLWQSNAPDLLDTMSYSIWLKPGTAASATDYSRVAVVGLQLDPLAVAALVDRAVLALGEDPLALENTIDNLFEDLAVGSISLAEKMAAVILGALAEPRYVENLLLAARRHPALNMALGQAVALPIPAAGPVTIEVREFDPVAQRDLGVIGRVTVDHDAPVHLPGPSALVLTPPNPRDGYNNLNVKLVWDTPPELRRVMLMTQGYNLYRVNKLFAEAQSPDWSVTSPDAALLAGLAQAHGSGVERVNQGPITPDQMLLAAELGMVDHTVTFYTDEETRFPGYPATHVPPANGDQYYYFVTVRDLLGNDTNSGTSPAALGTFCDTMPPLIPSGLQVTNQYVWDGGSDSQFLRLRWELNDNSGAKQTTGYFVYRWLRSDDVYRFGTDPVAQLVAGPIWPAPGQTHLTWDDPGPYDASTGLTYDNTVWYTLRASDDGSLSGGGAALCFAPPFGNLSGHTPPVPGVLRDRVGPDAPSATILTWCFTPIINADRARLTEDREFDPDYYAYLLIATRPAGMEPIVAVDFQRILENEQIVDLGRVHFAKGSDKLELTVRELFASSGKSTAFRARAVSSFGDLTNWEPIFSQQSPQPGTRMEFLWHTDGVFQRIVHGERASNYSRPCQRVHFTPPSGWLPPDEDPWIIVVFNPTPTMRQYKIYYRVDNGPLILAEEGSGVYVPTETLEIPVKLLPANAANICLFLQVFDLNGNPSRMQRLGCLSTQGTEPIATPMMKPIRSEVSGITPVARISWVCPPHGIDRFRVWIAATPQPVVSTSSPLLYDDPTNPPPNRVNEPVGNGEFVEFDYHSFNSELIGPLFGAGAQFQVEVPVMFGSKIRVKVAALTAQGEVGPWSNAVDFVWQPEPEWTGPDIPWPARPLPGVGTALSFSPDLASVYLSSRGTAAVRIGRVEGFCESIPDTKEEFDYYISRPELTDVWLFSRSYGSPALERSILPAMLYRTQIADGSLYTSSTISGDVVQVSPLMESIISVPSSGGRMITDPFIHVQTSDRDQRFCDIFLLDTQPQISGARYAYLMVLFDDKTMEMLHIIPVGSVTIP